MANISVQYVPIEQLTLDPNNPRIAPLLETLESTPDRDWVRMALGMYSSDDEERSTSTSYMSLKESIRASRGVMQPIIVAPREDGTFKVVEGNTRVAIYLELARDEVEGDWSTIAAIVRDVQDEKGEHAIRLQAHLVGPRPWKPYAKAKYLHDLYHGKKLSIAEIHAHCGGGGRRREIEEYIQAYADMQEYYVPVSDSDLESRLFAAFILFVQMRAVARLPASCISTSERCGPWTTLHESLGVLLDTELHRSTKVDVREGVIVFLLQIDTPAAENSSRDRYLQERFACCGRGPARQTPAIRRPCHFAGKIRLPRYEVGKSGGSAAPGWPFGSSGLFFFHHRLFHGRL